MALSSPFESVRSIGQKIGATIFGLIFGSIGLFIAIMAARSGLQARETRVWLPVACTIEQVSVESTSDGYRLDLSYSYRHDGRSFSSSDYTRGGSCTFKDIATRQQLLERYAPGSSHTCFVNPGNPAEAVLRQSGSLGMILGPVAFCSIFILIGYGMVIGTWLPRGQFSLVRHKSSRTKGATGGRLFLLCFGGIFLAIGLGVTYATFVKPLRLQLAARHWISTPATVIDSQVRVHRGDDSTTYSVYVAYSYTHNGKTYYGDRYAFSSGSTSGHGDKQATVRQYPKGRTFQVFLNPEAPHESVIIRDATKGLWLGLIPIIFAVVGAVVIVAGLRFGRRKTPKRVKLKPGRHAAADARETVLKPSHGRVGRIVGITFFSLFWNGITSVFVVQIAKEWMGGGRPIGSSLFISIFVLIGLGTVGGIIYEILRAFNPRVRFDLPPTLISLGTSLHVPFQIEGRANRIKSLAITLEGQEVATYNRGTDTCTATREFYVESLYETDQFMHVDCGSVRLAIPPDTMHTFKSNHNEIRWCLKVHGAIPRWPDISDSYTLNVIPTELRP